jgi:hypothetical protein
MKDEIANSRVLIPATWPGPPVEMSVSTYADIDECPRRWALGAAEYPDVWSGRGYPPKLQVAALAGSVVHLALELITNQFTGAGVPSLNDPSATQVLRELGGYTRVVEDCLDRILKRFSDNPRALPVMEHARRTLRGQVPTLRARVQSMVARLRVRALGKPALAATAANAASTQARSPLTNGTHAEVELRAKSIGWKGKADLLVLSPDGCEITDFKTGAADEEHQFQIRVYALLWSRDADLNPDRRRADRLFLAYNRGDVEVPAPTESELDDLEVALAARREAAQQAVSRQPPEARPNPTYCRYCAVRHLCVEYWTPGTQRDMARDVDQRFIDAEVKVTGRHGPSSWDIEIERCLDMSPGQAAVLRTHGDGEYRRGDRLRLLDVAFTSDDEDTGPHLFTLGELSEAYVVR